MDYTTIKKELKKDGDIAIVAVKKINGKFYTDWVKISSLNSTDGEEIVVREAVRILIGSIKKYDPS